MNMSVSRYAWRLAPLLIGVALLPACGTLRYLQQAAAGQAEVSSKARPIPEVIADPATSADLVKRLKLALAIRAYAVTELKLPDNASFTRFSDLGRPYVLWNVVATPALSLAPLESCFPIAGCLQYRGYYAESDAAEYATALRGQGMDVFLYGVPAYSTLGWFQDPLLNTSLRYGDVQLARLIFHELAHQVLYVKDDSSFNEAFATAVELEGVERWLKQRGDEASLSAYRLSEQRARDFRALMARGHDELSAVYHSQMPDAEKAKRKHAIQAALREDYLKLKQSWHGYTGYDSWFDPLPNNGHFASLATYHEKVAAFRSLFAQTGGDYQAFYTRVKALAGLDKASRLARLQQ